LKGRLIKKKLYELSKNETEHLLKSFQGISVTLVKSI